MATHARKNTAAPTAAQQDRIVRTVTPICRKCGKDLEPEQISSASREGKTTCKDCLGTVRSAAQAPVPVTVTVTVPEEATKEPAPITAADEWRQKMRETLARARAIRAEQLAANKGRTPTV